MVGRAIRSLGARVLYEIPSLDRARIRRKVLGPAVDGDYPFDVEIRVLRRLVAPGDVFVDVGAHDGIYSILVEDAAGPENVHSFEPIPTTFERLRRRRRGASVHRMALSSSVGTAPMRIPTIRGRVTATRASLEQSLRESGEEGWESAMVPVSTLDVMVEDLGLDRLDWLKIDVEGHEMEVLEGASETIRRFHPVLIIEIEQRHHDWPIQRAFERIRRLGYEGAFIDRGDLTLRAIDRFDVEVHQAKRGARRRGYCHNFLFLPEMRAVEMGDRIAAILRVERLIGGSEVLKEQR
jgi:FkbM family methyltransferase